MDSRVQHRHVNGNSITNNHHYFVDSESNSSGRSHEPANYLTIRSAFSPQEMGR